MKSRCTLLVAVWIALMLASVPVCAKPKIKFTKWEFTEGTSAIVAAPAEVAEGVPFRTYAGYRIGGGNNVTLGPRPAKITYDKQENDGTWKTGIIETAPKEAYKLTEWSDKKYTGVWDRRAGNLQIILKDGGNPPNCVSITYKYDYDTRRIKKDYHHEEDENSEGPIESGAASPRVWKKESYLPNPPANTQPGVVRCMPVTATATDCKIVECVLQNGTLQWRDLYTLPKD